MLRGAMKSLARNLDALRGFVEMVGPVLQENAEQHFKERFGDFILGSAISVALLETGDGESAKLEPIRDLIDRVLSDGFPVKAERGIRDDEQGVYLIQVATGEQEFLPERRARAIAAANVAEATQAHHQAELLYRSALVSLIGYSEWFFGQVLSAYFNRHLELAGSSERCFSYRDLESFQDLDEARAYLVSERVTEVLRGSVSGWLEYLKANAKVTMNGYLAAEKDALVEAFERRNLIVHNNCVVNRIYLRNVADEYRCDLDIGAPIPVTREYLEAAIDRLEKVFVLVAAELWKKLEPTDKARAFTLNELAYPHMLAGRWAVSQGLSQFASEDKPSDETDRLIGGVNSWLSRKRIDGLDAVAEEIRSIDFSAKQFRFKVAQVALLDDFAALIQMIPEAIEHEEVALSEVYEWPLFEELRAHETFSELAAIIGQPEQEDVGPGDVLEADMMEQEANCQETEVYGGEGVIDA